MSPAVPHLAPDLTPDLTPDLVPGLASDLARSGITTLSTMVPRRDRCLPVDGALEHLFPDGGLVGGQVIGFAGPASVSLVMAVAARSVAAGSWMAVVGVPVLGLEAAGELGVPLERVVAVEAGESSLEWAERVGVCADGFDVIVTTPPPRGADRLIRRVRQRLQDRGGVLLMIETTDRDSGRDADLTLTTTDPCWMGIGHGHGALLARTVTVRAGGRRARRPVESTIWLPDHTSRVSLVESNRVESNRVELNRGELNRGAENPYRLVR